MASCRLAPSLLVELGMATARLVSSLLVAHSATASYRPAATL